MTAPRLTSACLVLLAGLIVTSPASAEPPAFHEWMLGRGRLGIQVQPMTPELREYFGAPREQGVLVVRVEPERPAAKAGVEVGDVVLSVAGETIDSPKHLVRAVRELPEGEPATLVVLRRSERRSVEVVPDDPEEAWSEFEGHWEQGSRELRRRLDQLERRLEEFQRRFEQQLRELEERQLQKT